VPFTGLEVTSDFYFDMLSTLITPVNQEEKPIIKAKDKSVLGANALNLSSFSQAHA
jgi:hypothetical protein